MSMVEEGARDGPGVARRACCIAGGETLLVGVALDRQLRNVRRIGRIAGGTWWVGGGSSIVGLRAGQRWAGRRPWWAC
jgi:hypothetical protein